MLVRGGGPERWTHLRDLWNALNCSQICVGPTSGAGFFQTSDNRWLVYYLKCYEGVSPTPMNDKRIQFVSQIATMDLDPALPQMNVTHWQACMRVSPSLLQ